jgi:predicted nucleic acid-binding protein
MTSVFVDRTTLIYSLDPADPAKLAASRMWLKRLTLSNMMTLNVQVLNEAYWTLTRKSRFRWLPELARSTLNRLRRSCTASLDFDT